MNTILKILSIILGVVAVLACLAAIGIIGYSVIKTNISGETADITDAGGISDNNIEGSYESTQTPDALPELSPDDAAVGEGSVDMENHVHDYKESVDIQATCTTAGRLKFTCDCGAYYFVEIHTTGHVADDWEVDIEPAESKDGLRVKRCIYCDTIMAQESIPYNGEGNSDGRAHVHQYTAEVQSEPTCTVAGIRKYTCSCGAFYTEHIPALGHIVGEWTVVNSSSSSEMGLEERICSVCHTLIDSRGIPKLSPTPTPGSSSSPTASTGSTAAPTPTPHTHNYTGYVYRAATCTQIGVMTYNCSCGSEYSESIPIDSNNHKYKTTIVPPTKTEKGYTTYVCTRCNYNYIDNYTNPTG